MDIKQFEQSLTSLGTVPKRVKAQVSYHFGICGLIPAQEMKSKHVRASLESEFAFLHLFLKSLMFNVFAGWHKAVCLLRWAGTGIQGSAVDMT